jgi:hypothetical protein
MGWVDWRLFPSTKRLMCVAHDWMAVCSAMPRVIHNAAVLTTYLACCSRYDFYTATMHISMFQLCLIPSLSEQTPLQAPATVQYDCVVRLDSIQISITSRGCCHETNVYPPSA